MKLHIALNAELAKKKISKGIAVKRAGIVPSYGYQILDGKKENPTRDKVIMMCIGIGMSYVETQNLLKVTGYPSLYPRNQRDSFIIFAIENKYDIITINLNLQKLNLPILE